MGYLYVSVAHVVFVSLQRQVSVFLTNKTYKSLSIPPSLSVKTQCSPSSVQHSTKSIKDDINLMSTVVFSKCDADWFVSAATTYLAMLSPLKKRAMSWSEDCHGNPLALITVLSHTFSILLLHKNTHTDTKTLTQQEGTLQCSFMYLLLVNFTYHVPVSNFSLTRSWFENVWPEKKTVTGLDPLMIL